VDVGGATEDSGDTLITGLEVVIPVVLAGSCTAGVVFTWALTLVTNVLEVEEATVVMVGGPFTRNTNEQSIHNINPTDFHLKFTKWSSTTEQGISWLPSAQEISRTSSQVPFTTWKTFEFGRLNCLKIR
jgi:hypothetical protein